MIWFLSPASLYVCRVVANSGNRHLPSTLDHKDILELKSSDEDHTAQLIFVAGLLFYMPAVPGRAFMPNKVRSGAIRRMTNS